ncbi:MAG TPA: chemotaxis protein CheB [Ramlibacter sp.]|uniref:chemotaxis protein CheB n=1 Tax=Ramlibacter sp. TaxID=1917967 RepID=UPI002BDF9CC4|nr:chemotaxis protein CheB [Ramlibacter sp.]HVZ44712.1 chemotaxis protein CheB [Ramlibacter sp.]
MKTSVPEDFDASADVVAIGASAGGVDALFTVLTGLRKPLRGSVIMVLHLPQDFPSRLAEVFSARLALQVEEAQPGAPVAPGKLYFAAPGYHLLVENDRTFALSCDPPVLFSRPSIDVLMESCADVYGRALAGVVLTGANEDGARGLAAVAARGGITAVQDPAEAVYPTMPRAAVAAARPDYVLPLAGLARLVQTVLR